jgi:hypothetical protein
MDRSRGFMPHFNHFLHTLNLYHSLAAKMKSKYNAGIQSLKTKRLLHYKL